MNPSWLFLLHKKHGKTQCRAEAPPCHLPLPELCLLPRVPLLIGRDQSCGITHVMEESQGPVGKRKRQNKGRRMGGQSGCCRTRLLTQECAWQPISLQPHSFPLVPHRQHCLCTPLCSASQTKPNMVPCLLSAYLCRPTDSKPWFQGYMVRKPENKKSPPHALKPLLHSSLR